MPAHKLLRLYVARCATLEKRLEKCIEVEGGHFEPPLQLPSAGINFQTHKDIVLYLNSMFFTEMNKLCQDQYVIFIVPLLLRHSVYQCSLCILYFCIYCICRCILAAFISCKCIIFFCCISPLTFKRGSIRLERVK